MINTQHLPHSEDLEKGLLSSIRHRPEILLEISHVLHADMFYIPAHRHILEAFSAITEGLSAGIDFYAIKNWLIASGKLEEAGGLELLS
jgi:replicative DNA helicase